MRDLIGMIQRGLRKPPRVILERIVTELRAELERFRIPWRRRLKLSTLLEALEAQDLKTLWDHLALRPYPAVTSPVDLETYEACCPGDHVRILVRAEDALAHRVNILGSGIIELGDSIDWLKDFKSGINWPPAYFRHINFYAPDDCGDVKVPWELSRLQWLIPLGQAYLLTGDERYAEGTRSILEHWIDHNPYAGTVNWASTMEVALRILTMTWFFHVFYNTAAWKDALFREKFLRTLFLHCEFTERHLVGSDVNSGVYIISAAGLLFGGLFFGKGLDAERWQSKGWAMCREEIQRQICPDGVDFEGSVSYHRLALESFLLPALYQIKHGMLVEEAYRDRLISMAGFTRAYTKPNGMAPLWGDDGGTRVLPFGSQDINNHCFVIGVVGEVFGRPELHSQFSGPREEVFWLLGDVAAKSMPTTPVSPSSMAFPDGGFFVMRGEVDHVFVDCGPVGLVGRGGHGHNDCLSFEAVLDGVPLISDCGTFVYTASYDERNAFRSTAYHNTPQIDGEEINRFTNPDWLWSLHYDAVPDVLRWEANTESALFMGQHQGYQRLIPPVVPKRTILVDFNMHSLYVEDQFVGEGMHFVSEPLHLAPGVEVAEVYADAVILNAQGKYFRIWWRADSDYEFELTDGRISPSYGVVVPIKKLIWTRKDASLVPFALMIAPATGAASSESCMMQHLAQYEIEWPL